MATKHDVYRKLKELNVSYTLARKNAMSNIVFPKFDEIGLIGDIFRQDVKTKEQPDGEVYEEDAYRVVWRIYNGKLYNADGRLDVYCWSDEDFNNKATKAVPIGTGSALGIIHLAETLASLNDYRDKIALADMFRRYNEDMLLVDSKSELRSVVEVTDALYKEGITSCIDSWMKPDADGNYAETKLNVGDFLVMNHEKETVYCIVREAFFATHTIV